MFNPLKPDAGPSPALDAPTIQNNFATYAAIFASTVGGVNYNHTAMNNINQGDHEVVLMEVQLADPGVTQDLDVLYAKNAISNVSTQPQLFVQIPKFLPTADDTTNAPNAPMQLTYNTVNIAGPVYQSFIAGGYIVYMGSTTNIALPVILSPIPTQILIAIAEPNKMNGNIPFMVSTVINNATHDRFTIFSSGITNPYTFCWMAVAIA